ncbi:MAG: glycosyltransferase family 2 protein [Thalassotalea sp.]
MEDKLLQICVVAHNEQEHILGCLQSIEVAIAAANISQYCVHIINNGSSDNTQIIAETFCADKTPWFAHNIALGDKANAFNLGVYNYATADALTVYIDGDCKISAGTLSAFITAHQDKPNAYIYAAIPMTQGNTTQQTIKNTLAGTALSGNLFALSEQFIKKLREKSFKLPVGLIGDDSLLAWVSSHDFKLSNGVISGYLVGVEGAKFEYHRLAPTSWSNIKLYYRRLTRYSLRHLQQKCIREFLNEHDAFEKLPESINALYELHKPEHIRTEGLVNQYFDKKSAKILKKLKEDK